MAVREGVEPEAPENEDTVMAAGTRASGMPSR